MANVLDFTCDQYPEDLIRDIFNHQHALAVKYLPIEEKNGLLLYKQLPADIDDAKAQARIKDMSWRAVEEIAEAFEALDLNEVVHFYEEMADAMHFLVEKYLLCNFIPTKPGEAVPFFGSSVNEVTNLSSFFHDSLPVLTDEQSLRDRRPLMNQKMAEFIEACGLTCNCLKNKPWKQSQMITDQRKFYHKLSIEFESFIDLCMVSGFTDKSLYDMYIRKNQVNQFRQRSNY